MTTAPCLYWHNSKGKNLNIMFYRPKLQSLMQILFLNIMPTNLHKGEMSIGPIARRQKFPTLQIYFLSAENFCCLLVEEN